MLPINNSPNKTINGIFVSAGQFVVANAYTTNQPDAYKNPLWRR